jgi:hypothetical protein
MFLAYLGHLAGEEYPADWAIEILDNMEDGSTIDLLIDKAFEIVLKKLNEEILPPIPINTNMVTHESGSTWFTSALKTGIALTMPNLGSLLNTMGININEMAGGLLNSSIISGEYKFSISSMIYNLFSSWLFDDNYLKDNNTVLYWEDENNGHVAVPDILSNNITVIYPNPVKDELYIETRLNIKEISIFDIYGKTVKQIQGKAVSIPVDELPSGVYFVKITTGEGVLPVKKVVKL